MEEDRRYYSAGTTLSPNEKQKSTLNQLSSSIDNMIGKIVNVHIKNFAKHGELLPEKELIILLDDWRKKQPLKNTPKQILVNALNHFTKHSDELNLYDLCEQNIIESVNTPIIFTSGVILKYGVNVNSMYLPNIGWFGCEFDGIVFSDIQRVTIVNESGKWEAELTTSLVL